MTIQPLTVREARTFVNLANRRGGLWEFRAKECWFNAQSLKLADLEGVTEYVEGYFCWDNGPLPIDHAWVTLNGKVIDVTARAAAKMCAHTYIGVTVPRPALSRHLKHAKFWTPVMECRQCAERVFPEVKRAKNAE